MHLGTATAGLRGSSEVDIADAASQGEKTLAAAPRKDMSEHTSASGRALADFVDELLECGAVLSQVVSHMVRFEAAGLASPDAAPIPATAHKLICDVLSDVKPRRSRRDLATAAAIVKEATEAICQNLFFVDIDTTALGANGDLGAPGE